MQLQLVIECKKLAIRAMVKQGTLVGGLTGLWRVICSRVSSDNDTRCLTGLTYLFIVKMSRHMECLGPAHHSTYIHVRVRACVLQAGVAHTFYKFFKGFLLANIRLIICMIEMVDQLVIEW